LCSDGGVDGDDSGEIDVAGMVVRGKGLRTWVWVGIAKMVM
jgi:hypothetical protein